jgi:hypothetical protein
MQTLQWLLTLNNVRRKLPLPREPAGAIPKEGTHLYWVFKLQGAVDWQYSFYADSCLVKFMCYYSSMSMQGCSDNEMIFICLGTLSLG